MVRSDFIVRSLSLLEMVLMLLRLLQFLDTTHLLLSKSQSPFILTALLSSRLVALTSTLVVLDISDSALPSLPSSIAACTCLEELNISGNTCPTGDLPPWIAYLVSLKVLAADRCGLVLLSTPLGTLQSLRDLSLRHNHLKSLPSWLCHLQALEVLLVDGNDFEPPWLELAEPLLAANYRFGEVDVLPGTIRNESATESSFSLPSQAHQSRRPSVAEDRPLHFHTTNGHEESARLSHQTICPPSSLILTNNTDQKRASHADSDSSPTSRDSSDRKSDSTESTERRNSYLRRLRSTGEIMGGSYARRTSYHDPAHTAAVRTSHGVVSSEPLTHHTFHSTLGFRDSSNLDLLEQTQSKGLPETADFSPPPQVPPNKEVKKSFGFLKKMSLGKLRREVTSGRPRTKTIETRTAPSSVFIDPSPMRPTINPLMAPPKAFTADVLPTISSKTPFEVPDRPSIPSTQSADTSERAPVSDRKRSRRSFLKLEPHLANWKFEPLPLIPSPLVDSFPPIEDLVAGSIQASPVIQDVPSHKPPLSRPIDALIDHSSPIASRATSRRQTPINRPSSIDPRTGLRSIMMYLRDVHDLSGEPAALPEMGSRPGQISRASSRKHIFTLGSNSDFQPPSGRSSNMGTLTNMSTYGDLDGEPDGASHVATVSPQVASTGSMPTVGQPKVTDNPARRMKVVEEILATEKSYIRGLKELQEIYIAGARAMSASGIGKDKEPTVPAMERKIVFNNVEAIIGFHVEVLLPDLQEVMDRLTEKQVSILSPANFGTGLSARKAKRVEAKQKDPGGEFSVLVAPASDEVLDEAGCWEVEEPGILQSQRDEIAGELIKVAAEELARVFIRHAAFLKLYSTYITQFDVALERLREWTVTASNTPTLNSMVTMQQPSTVAGPSSSSWSPSANGNAANMHISTAQKKRLKSYLKRCRANPAHSQMNLESYLLMPVQRLPRYKLLLENLQSCTPDHRYENQAEEDAPRPNLMVSEALSLISAVTAEMNERKRDSEGRQRLVSFFGLFLFRLVRIVHFETRSLTQLGG